MRTAWYKLAETNELKEQIKAEFEGSQFLRETLDYILTEKIQDIDKESLSKKNYLFPRWSEYQADLIGFKRALYYVKEMLDA